MRELAAPPSGSRLSAFKPNVAHAGQRALRSLKTNTPSYSVNYGMNITTNESARNLTSQKVFELPVRSNYVTVDFLWWCLPE